MKRRPVSWKAEQTLLGAGPVGWVILAAIYQVYWTFKGEKP